MRDASYQRLFMFKMGVLLLASLVLLLTRENPERATPETELPGAVDTGLIAPNR